MCTKTLDRLASRPVGRRAQTPLLQPTLPTLANPEKGHPRLTALMPRRCRCHLEQLQPGQPGTHLPPPPPRCSRMSQG